MGLSGKRKKILWIDVETTGLDPILQDIYSLAYIIDIDGKVEEEGELLIRPYNFLTIDNEALKVGGTTVEELEKVDYTISDAVIDLKRVWGKYIDKFDKSDKFVVGGYYVRFDCDFLRSMFKKAGDRYGIGSWCFTPLLEVSAFVAEQVTKVGLRLPNFKLATVCERYGIEFEAHNALEDVRAARQLYYTLSEIKEVL